MSNSWPETAESEATKAVEQPAVADTPRRLWRYIAGAVIVGVVAVTGTLHGLGGHDSLIVFAIAGGAAFLLLVLWRLPQLRKHFARPRGSSRPRRLPSAGRRPSLSRMLSGGGKRGAGSSLTGKGKGALGKAVKGALGKPATGRRNGLGRLLPKGLTGKGSAGSAGKGLSGRIGKALSGRGGKSQGASLGKLGRAIGKGSGARGGARRGGLGRLVPKHGGGGRSSGSGRRSRGGGGKGSSAGPKVRATPGRLARGARSAIGKTRRAGAGVRKALTAAGLAPLVPFIAAGLGGKRAAKWLSGRRTPKATAPSQPSSPAAPAPGVPPVRQPGVALAPRSAQNPSRRRQAVSSVVDAVTEAVDQHIGQFEPENVEDLGEFLRGLPELYEALSGALTRVADRFADELPVDSRVSEHVREMASQAAGLREYADEAHGIFRSAHEEELNRLENPRAGEQMWDLTQQ